MSIKPWKSPAVADTSQVPVHDVHFTRLVPLGCRSIHAGAPASFLNSCLCSFFPSSIASRCPLSLGNCVKGSDADRSLSEQVRFRLCVLLKPSHPPATPAATTLHYHTTSTIGRPRSSSVEYNTIVTGPSPHSFTTPEAFNRYFRSFSW